MPRSRHGRLPFKTNSRGGPLRGHPPGGPGRRSVPDSLIECRRPHEPARPSRPAGCLRRCREVAGSDGPKLQIQCPIPVDRDRRRPSGSGWAAVAQGRSQAPRYDNGILHRGRGGCVRPRRPCRFAASSKKPSLWWNDSERWSGNSSSRSTACRSRLCETRSGMRAILTGEFGLERRSQWVSTRIGFRNDAGADRAADRQPPCPPRKTVRHRRLMRSPRPARR